MVEVPFCCSESVLGVLHKSCGSFWVKEIASEILSL